MNKHSISIAIVAMVTFTHYSIPSFAQEEEKSSVHIGLVYPISNHGTHAKDYSNVFSFHVIAGVSKEETGVSIAGFSNLIQERAEGAQVAGFSNVIGTSVDGFTIAGFLNKYESGKGFQLAGFSNFAREDVTGFQLAGFLNKARKVKGVQFAGFMNIADSSDYPIGLVNLIKNGTKAIGISTDENQTVLASFRSGGRVMYSIIGVGYNVKNTDLSYAFEAGIGAHLVKMTSFALTAELASTNLLDFKKGTFSTVSVRILPAYRIAKKIEVYAGPTFNHVYTNTAEGKGMLKHTLWREEYSKGDVGALNIGFIGGLQLYF